MGLYTLNCGDCREWLRTLPDDGADLLFTSPPYEAARTYGIDFNLRGQAWVDWMVEVVTLAAPKVKGLIAINCEGQTRGYSYSGTPFLLFADLKRSGFNMRKPCVYERDGVPGSGGPDWLKNRWEPIICVTRCGRLPWSDNTACGKPPKYEPGGDFSNRTINGDRVNADVSARPNRKGIEKQVQDAIDGTLQLKPGPVLIRSPLPNGEMRTKLYIPPDVANPGNIIDCGASGGGALGSSLAHENEAPFPLDLAAFFVKSFCPPGGLVLDPFMGSGTTGHAAIENGRRFAGCDIRQSQLDLATRRLRSVTPPLVA